MITQLDGSSVAGVADTRVGPSPAIWNRFNVFEMKNNPNKGTYFFDDFNEVPSHASSSGAAVSGPFGRYGHYVYQGGFIRDKGLVTANVGGVIEFGSDGDNEGAAIYPGAGCMQFVSTKGKAAFEARIGTSTITDTKHGLFCGLIQGGAFAAAVPIATDGTLADVNFIGFHRLEGDGDYLNLVYKADGQTQVTLLDNAIELAVDTYVKVGLLYEPLNPLASKITFFKNGIPLTTFVTGTQMAAVTFPSDISLGPCFGVMNATGSTPGTSYIDWWQGAQERI